MDIANEDSFVPLSFRLGQSEAGESIGPQIHTSATAYSGEFHIARNMGYTESKGHGPAEDWYEQVVRKHNGSPS